MLHPRILIGRPFPEFPSEAWVGPSNTSVEAYNAVAKAWAEAFCAFRENSPLERMAAPVEPVAREHLRKAGLPFDPGLSYVLQDPQEPGWRWEGTLEYLMKYWYGEDSAEFYAANLLRLIHNLRLLRDRQGPPESVTSLTTQLYITLDYAKHTRLFTPRGRQKNSRSIPESFFRQRYPEVYRQCADDYMTPPKKKDIAEALGIHPKTFSRYLTDYRLTFPPS